MSIDRVDPFGTWSIMYNYNTCGHTSDGVTTNTTVSFSEGRETGTNFLALERQTIDVVCTFETFYKVEYEFAMDKTLETHDDNSVAGGIQFRMDAFSDAEKTTELDLDNLFSGTQVYLSLFPVVADEMMSIMTFAPTKCVFTKTEENVDDISFTLFESSENNCDQIYPELGFSLDFRAADQVWDISYKLFTFGENEASTYKLECDVVACYSTDGTETCREVAEQCDNDYSENVEFWSPSSPDSTGINWSTATRIFSTGYTYTSRNSPAFDDDYYYFATRDDKGEIQENQPVVYAFDKSTFEIAKIYLLDDDDSKGYSITHMAMSDKYIIGSEQVNKIIVWDKDTTEKLSTTILEENGAVSINENKVLVSSRGVDGPVLYTVNEDGSLTKESVPDFANIENAAANTFHDGKMIMTGEVNGVVSILGYDENYNRVFTLTGHSGNIVYVFSYNEYLVTSGGSEIRIWDPVNQTLLKTIALSATAYGLEVRDGYIISHKDNKKIEIRDFDQVLNGNNDEPIHTIEDAWRQCYSMILDYEAHQLMANCGGSFQTWQFQVGSN